MAAGSKLILRFGTMSGEKNFTFNYGDAETTASAVKALGTAMIANGSIFRFPPLTMISAKAQVTTETTFDIS